ncbi:copper homeostasis protein CutC [Pedobacter heparinus]|uniref:copper homeostasis protein CutC n=1 Tax=Pedobacter heparinus TaxID=984 RepID=UPI00292E13ED|nr:copper homeostasis protein CutC [Pedobacter heparinus]
MMVNMKVCANSLRSALAAQEGGAIRVELCDNLPEGGTTPSYSQIEMAKKMLNIQVYPIIRPRGGDFLYTDLEFELMKADIKACRELGCDGAVLGILKHDGSVDKERCGELIALAGNMHVTFHRAFDLSNNLPEALEDIIKLGCVRLLSSGGESSALKGAEMLQKLIAQARDRISIMPGAGINANNIQSLIRQTGAKEFHASASKSVASEMRFRNINLRMGAAADEYMVKQLIALANRTEL